MGNVLKTQIHGQVEIVTRPCAAHYLDVLDQPATAILDNLPAAGNTLEPLVVGKLQAFLTRLIDVGKPDQMRGHVARRIKAAIFLDTVYTGHLEISNGLAVLRGHVPAQVDELATGIGLESVTECLGVGSERLGQLGPAPFVIDQLRGVCPQRHDWGTHRERFTVTIGYQAPMRRNRHMAHTALVALVAQKTAIKHMQLDDLPGNDRRAHAEQADYQPEAPGVAAAVWLDADHGFTMMTSVAAGTRISS